MTPTGRALSLWNFVKDWMASIVRVIHRRRTPGLRDPYNECLLLAVRGGPVEGGSDD